MLELGFVNAIFILWSKVIFTVLSFIRKCVFEKMTEVRSGIVRNSSSQMKEADKFSL